MAKFTEIFSDETKRGYKIPTSEYLPSGKFPIIDQGQGQIAGYTDLENGVFTDVPAIIFGDHTRIVKYVDTPFFLGADGVKVLKAKIPDVDYKYLFYCLQNAKIPDTGYNRHFKWLKEIEIPLVSLDEQRRIAAVLDKVTDLIAQRRAQLDKLDLLVKSRFVEMFGDPFTNPYGWPKKHFDEISTIITDGEHATPKRSAEGIYLLSARNILNHSIQVDDVDYIDETEYNRISKRIVPASGDLLISCSGSIGRCCVVPPNFKFQMVRSVALIRFDKCINPVFAEWLIASDELQKQIKQSSTQSSQANLFQGRIKKLYAYVPPIELQNQFSNFVKQTEKVKDIIHRSFNGLDVLKRTLMQQYFG